MTLNGKTRFISFYVGNKKYFWLIDTGASISVIKKDAVPINTSIFRDDTVINGIAGQIQSAGYVSLQLTHNIEHSGMTFNHKFFVFDSVPLKADGILGLDFLCKHASNIDLGTNIITFYLNGMECSLPMYDTVDYSNEILVLPARSESVHYLFLDSKYEGDYVIN